MNKYSTPVLVKDVLRKFSGFGIALARKNPLPLPSDFLLKLGNRYHLIPCAEGFESVEESGMVEKEESGGVTRIKVVITKKQFQDLLSKQVLAADILSVLRSETYDGDDDDDDDDFSKRIWKPKLESIPEEHETSSIL
ncbi:hypothetical protein POM88_011216 [Heracleum sosnowskyi]|uniref:Uncharacterized protein n=1 Tax=Heracleum sosnowskyi TaxID=360622 RepID=A0AAD8MWB4_9APIA|nr:hypothetical protein POM88_011216 [Heracleum sosnowskyi]